jgi:hypothetical protein
MRSSYGSTNGNGESPTATTSTYSEMGNAAVPVPVPDVVPVAAAPKDNNLYDALLRYHTENDDSDDAESEDWRRRNQRDSPRNKNTSAEYEYEDYAVAVAGAAGKDDADADADHSRKKKSPPQDTTEDRKLPARSTNHYLKQAPPKSKSAPVPATFQKAPPSLAAPTTGDLLKSLSPPSSPVSPRTRGAASSFYQAALAESWMREESPHNNHNHNHTIPSSHSPKKVLSKPGIVHVNEPAIRPDSAMYRAAYGGGPSSQSQSHPSRNFRPCKHPGPNRYGSYNCVAWTTTTTSMIMTNNETRTSLLRSLLGVLAAPLPIPIPIPRRLGETCIDHQGSSINKHKHKPVMPPISGIVAALVLVPALVLLPRALVRLMCWVEAVIRLVLWMRLVEGEAAIRLAVLSAIARGVSWVGAIWVVVPYAIVLLVMG